MKKSSVEVYPGTGNTPVDEETVKNFIIVNGLSSLLRRNITEETPSESGRYERLTAVSTFFMLFVLKEVEEHIWAISLRKTGKCDTAYNKLREVWVESFPRIMELLYVYDVQRGS